MSKYQCRLFSSLCHECIAGYPTIRRRFSQNKDLIYPNHPSCESIDINKDSQYEILKKEQTNARWGFHPCDDLCVKKRFTPTSSDDSSPVKFQARLIKCHKPWWNSNRVDRKKSWRTGDPKNMTHGYPWSELDQTSHSHNSQISTLKD